MPPAAAKDIYVILLDLKAKPQSSALHALSEVVLYQQLSQSKNQFKLYLINSAQSSNNLDYQGIRNIDASTNIGDLLDEIMVTDTGTSDWLEALDVGVEELKGWADTPGVITLQLLFITDVVSFERPNNGKLMDKVINDISSFDIFLYVIGPPIEPPKTIFSEQDVTKWMRELEVDKDNSNLKIMKKIITKTPHSVMCNYDIGVNLFHSLKYTKGMQPWQVPLTFGTLLHLPASTIRITKREPPFKLKNTSTGRAFGGDVKWAYEDQQDVLIDIHDTVSGVVKHGKFIKIETDGRFKIEGPRSFQALGFTPAENVPEYLLQADASYLVIPDPKQESYFPFFNALVDELAESNLCILVRRVYNKDFNPKFAVLIPRKDLNVKSFIMCQIPYADDVAHAYKEQDPDSAPKLEPNQKIFSFLDSINVSNENCKVKVPLAPNMMIYSSGLAIINKVEEKCIQEKLENKFNKDSVSAVNFDFLKDDWPVRDLDAKVKKEENPTVDFDDVEDFDFS